MRYADTDRFIFTDWLHFISHAIREKRHFLPGCAILVGSGVALCIGLVDAAQLHYLISAPSVFW